MKLGENIRNYRTEQGLTQEQLGEMVDVSAQAVSKWESDSSLPDTSLLPSIAKALHTSIDSLYGYDGAGKKGILEALYRYQKTLPYDHDKLMETVWELVYHAAYSTFWRDGYGIKLTAPKEDASIQIQWNEGFMQGWYRKNALFVLAPKPENGWNAVLADNEKVRDLFTAMGDKYVWASITWLMKHTWDFRFLFPVLVRDVGIPEEEAEKVRLALLKLRILDENELVMDGQKIKTYRYIPNCQFAALWIMAYNMLYDSQGYSFQQSSLTEAILKQDV